MGGTTCISIDKKQTNYVRKLAKTAEMACILDE
jgi:hypothetical protein